MEKNIMVKEEELKDKIKCPFATKCVRTITERHFQKYCQENFSECGTYDDLLEKKPAIEWVKTIKKKG